MWGEVCTLGHFSIPTRPVENVVITTKGLQDRNTNIRWDDDGK